MTPTPIPSEYYGDNSRWFIATVVSNQPPVGYEGRIKIRVHGLHSHSQVDIPERDLPWAQCVLPTTEGGVSGLGRIPRLQPSALVFGFFVDGINSQTPIILGSLPHIEMASEIQRGQLDEDVGEERPENFFGRVVDVLKPDDDVDDDNFGNIRLGITKNREKAAVKFFLNVGYTLNQAIGMAATLSSLSRMRTDKIPKGGNGINSWSIKRWTEMKAFSNDYLKFTEQLKFVVYELRTTESQANIRLLDTQNIEGINGSVEIFARFYSKKVNAKFIKQIELAARRLKDRI